MKKVKISLLAVILIMSVIWITPKHAHANVGNEGGRYQRCQDNPPHEGVWDWFWNCNYGLPAEDKDNS